jgi:hypothetical protein
MTEPRRRLVEIGTLPAGYDATFASGVDPLAVMLREGAARLDAERAEAERARLAGIAEIDRAKDARRARIARRFRRALKALTRMK